MRPTDVVLAVGMLVAGTINTIATKFQDILKQPGLPGSDSHTFNHPAVQTVNMFIGETLCLFVFFILQRRERSLARNKPGYEANKTAVFPIWLFLVPALCDMTGSTLMNVGLILTDPSVYQMLRGIIVVFTGIFSRIFLGRKLYLFHYIAMFLIIAGTAIVGVSSVINHGSKSQAPDPILGNCLVIAAQLTAAAQMVIEEKFLSKYSVPPLQVVGNEGAWGVLVVTIVLFVTYWITPIRRVDNSLDAIYQLYHGHLLIIAVVGSIFSIAVFNFFGISVTRQLSATHRTTIDATRVFLVWIVSLILRWETFQWLQLVGFIVLLLGTAIFNEIVRFPFFVYPAQSKSINAGEKDRLIDDN